MRADAQFAVVEAVIKGFNKWIEAHGKAPQQDVSLLVKLSPSLR
jgi:exportin-5